MQGRNQHDLATSRAEESNNVDEVQDAVVTVVDEMDGNEPESHALWIASNQAVTERRPDETRNEINSSKSVKKTLSRKIQLTQLRISKPPLLQLRKASTPDKPLEHKTRILKQHRVVLPYVQGLRTNQSILSPSHLSILSSLPFPFPFPHS